MIQPGVRAVDTMVWPISNVARDAVLRGDTPSPETPIRWYWHQRLTSALVRNHRLAFYIALDQLATVLSRERVW